MLIRRVEAHAVGRALALRLLVRELAHPHQLPARGALEGHREHGARAVAVGVGAPLESLVTIGVRDVDRPG